MVTATLGATLALSGVRIGVLGLLLIGSWGYFGYHWMAQHGDPDEADVTSSASGDTSPALSDPTALGTLPDSATFTPTPNFVSELAPPARGTEVFEAEGGVRYALYQLEHTNMGEEPREYVRIISEPVTSGGVDSVANGTVVLNPAFQTLELHTLRVERDGSFEDRTDSTTIEFARRETRLERRMFDGRATAIVRFSDIRIGDRVEYSYTITGRNPALPANDSREIRLGFGAPVERMLVTSTWPNSRPPHYRQLGPDAAANVTASSEGPAQTLRFGPIPTATFTGERSAPSWIRQSPSLQLSDFADWEDVSRWSAPMYQPGSSDAVDEIADRIRAEHADPADQLVAALRFTQDEIRYLAISFGAGGYVPAMPPETLERRYGDCKAKTVLLIALLEALDIEAEAALVHTSQGRALLDGLPRHTAFNHVIVRAYLDGEAYWLDGTRREQGGRLDTLDQPDFGFALPINTDGAAPVAMEPTPFGASFFEGEEALTIHSINGDATLEVTYTARNLGADRARTSLSRTGRADLQERFLDQYGARFGAVSSTRDLTIEDDREINVLIMHMQIGIENVLTPHEDGERLQASARMQMRSPTNGNAERNRRFPLTLTYPVHQTARLVVDLPDAMADWTLEPEARQLTVDGIDFSTVRSRDGNRITLDYTLLVDRPYLPPEEAAAALALGDQINQLTRWSLVSP